MPSGIRLSRSISSSSLLERKTATMTTAAQSLMDRDLCRSDSVGTRSTKRTRSFSLVRRRSSRRNDQFADDFSEACPGSTASSVVPQEQGFEAIVGPPIRGRNKSNKPPRTVHSKKPSWRCVPSPSISDSGLPAAVTSSCSEEDSPQERFDQSFDYAFGSVVWDHSVQRSTLVDQQSNSPRVDTATTLVAAGSNSNPSPPPSPTVQPTDPDPILNLPPKDQKATYACIKKPSKWRRFFWGGRRRKVEHSHSMTSVTPPRDQPKLTPDTTDLTERDWPEAPEVSDEPDWEARMDGDEVECEYRGDVMDWFSTSTPDSPTIQPWENRPLEETIGLEKEGEDHSLPNTTGVKELGQYARELEQSRSRPSPRAAKREPIPSLLCALPKFGGKPKHPSLDDDSSFSDPEWMDESLDDNSYLAVSYTGEGVVQLVMTQSEDVDPQRSLEESPETSREDSYYRIPPSENYSPKKEDEEYPRPQLDETVDISGTTADDSLHLLQENSMDMSYRTRDESLMFLGENPIESYRSLSNRSKSLGANFPHPAALVRNEFATQQLRRPSTCSKEEGDNGAANGLKGKADAEKPEDIASTKTPVNVEKEKRGSITFHHYKGGLLAPEQKPRKARIQPPNILRTVGSNQKRVQEPKADPPDQPWKPQRIEDPPAAPRRNYGLYGCTPPSIPACTNRSRSHSWLEQPTETMTWDPDRTMDSRTVSTLSFSVFPLQERRRSLEGSSRDVWDLYQPIRRLAKDVNETFCENLYPRMEQPSSVPFDEFDMDGRGRQGRPPWTKVVRTKSSSSSNFYSDYDRRRRDRRWREPSLSLDDDGEEEPRHARHGRPDPPSAMPRDTRRQLL